MNGFTTKTAPGCVGNTSCRRTIAPLADRVQRWLVIAGRPGLVGVTVELDSLDQLSRCQGCGELLDNLIPADDLRLTRSR